MHARTVLAKCVHSVSINTSSDSIHVSFSGNMSEVDKGITLHAINVHAQSADHQSKASDSARGEPPRPM